MGVIFVILVKHVTFSPTILVILLVLSLQQPLIHSKNMMSDEEIALMITGIFAVGILLLLIALLIRRRRNKRMKRLTSSTSSVQQQVPRLPETSNTVVNTPSFIPLGRMISSYNEDNDNHPPPPTYASLYDT